MHTRPMTRSYDFDFLVIGGGSAGVRASRTAAALGKKTLLVEHGPLGGTCVNVGCIPKKLYVYAAETPRHVEEARGFGWTLETRGFDWSTLQQNKNREIARLNEVYARIVTQASAEIERGSARLVGERTVEITSSTGTRRVTAEHVLVATGASARRPAVPGAELAWVSDDVFRLETLPRSIVVLGAGYVALELASVFAALGVKTKVLVRGPRILSSFDEDVATFVGKELARQHVELVYGADAARIERSASGLVVHDTTGRSFGAEAVLAAIGRVPASQDLGLESVGATLGRDASIVTSEFGRTNVPWLRAAGDVAGHAQLTPVALAEGMNVVHDLFAPERRRRVDLDRVATAVFTHPEVSTVGLAEHEARRRGHKLAVFQTEFRPLKHTVSGGLDRTFMKLVVDRDSDVVLGVHVAGDHAGEMVQGFAVALEVGAKKADFDRTIGIHPTAAEELVTMRTARSIDEG